MKTALGTINNAAAGKTATNTDTTKNVAVGTLSMLLTPLVQMRVKELYLV